MRSTWQIYLIRRVCRAALVSRGKVVSLSLMVTWALLAILGDEQQLSEAAVVGLVWRVIGRLIGHWELTKGRSPAAGG